MADDSEELEKLLLDVRKTISDNRFFLDKLLDETVDDVSEEDVEKMEGDFEEL